MKLTATLLTILLGSAVASAETLVLFDGSGLDAWQFDKDHWSLNEDGALKAREGRGYAWSHRRYGDFVLSLEYNIAPGGNSGVFFRTGSLHHPVQTGMELQVLDSADHGELHNHMAGALYDIVAPRVNAARPAGEWNHYILRAEGPLLRAELNGELAFTIDLDEWDTAGRNPDGSKNKFRVAYADMPREGHLGLQDHSDKVAYRDIRVKPLSTPRTPGEAPEPRTDGEWEILFDGSGTEQWQLDERAWVIRAGALVFLGAPEPIRTKKAFSDFELSLEFRPEQGEDARVQLYGGQGGWRERLMVNLTDEHRGQPKERFAAGALREFDAPEFDAAIQPGDLNRATLTATGDILIVKINGKEVNRVDLTALIGPDGERKERHERIAALDREGFIALDGQAEFRNVSLTLSEPAQVER
ncbi:MAG: DUF1080 domain-containing protein [Opitutales bacterium]